MSKSETCPMEKLEQAYSLMAVVIRDYGVKYLPIFKRLHEEMEAVKARRDLQSIALQIAKDVS